MKHDEKLVFRCRSCNKELEWGDEKCSGCQMPVVEGLPGPTSKGIGFIIYLVIVGVLFLVISLININLLNHALPPAIILAIAIVVGSIKFGIGPGMGFNPRHVHVKLDVSKLREDRYWTGGTQFNYCPKTWEKDRIEYDSVYDLLAGGLSSREGAEVLAFFPQDGAVDHLDAILRSSTDAETMMLAARSLVRIGTEKAKKVLFETSIFERILERIFADNDKTFDENDWKRFNEIADEKSPRDEKIVSQQKGGGDTDKPRA